MVAIEEIIRSCMIGMVFVAAAASVGGCFAATVERAASANGMTIGDYVRGSVSRFARKGHEAEMRAVTLEMECSESLVLAGLERIRTFDLALPSVACRRDGGVAS